MTRIELYVKTKDVATGRIMTNKRVTLANVREEALKQPYFNHWLFGGIRRKAAEFVFNFLESLKSGNGEG
jgi:hypothetical protein